MESLRNTVQSAGTLAIFGCGVEPGLTEIMARHAAEQMDTVDELHIKCGGIPEEPGPPLGYKIVFGGRSLPLRERMAQSSKMDSCARSSAIPASSGWSLRVSVSVKRGTKASCPGC